MNGHHFFIFWRHQHLFKWDYVTFLWNIIVFDTKVKVSTKNMRAFSFFPNNLLGDMDKNQIVRCAFQTNKTMTFFTTKFMDDSFEWWAPHGSFTSEISVHMINIYFTCQLLVLSYSLLFRLCFYISIFPFFQSVSVLHRLNFRSYNFSFLFTYKWVKMMIHSCLMHSIDSSCSP